MDLVGFLRDGVLGVYRIEPLQLLLETQILSVGRVNLLIQKLYLTLDVACLADDVLQLVLKYLASVRKLYTGLQKCFALLLQLLLFLNHLPLQLLLIGVVSQFVQLVLGSEHFPLVLLQQLHLFLVEHLHQPSVQVLDSAVNAFVLVLVVVFLP